MTLSSTALADSTSLKNLLQKPLILGASVSGDYLTKSPGKRLALRYTSEDQIKVIAAKGKPGREVLKSVNESSLKDRTVVIGLDLFFWDSFAGSSTESVKALENLIQTAKKNKITVVLGEIPVFMPQMQPSASVLNEKIKSYCRAYENCYFLPLQALLVKTLSDGYITYQGKKISVENLLPDGLHIATPASEFLADRIAEVLEKPHT